MNNKDKLEVSLLGFLYKKSMHGYDIYKEISDLSGIGIVWRVKTGKLYAMLHRLENNGWVSATTARAGNRPQKTQYSITAEGKTVFNEWLQTPVQRGREFRITFLLKLFFALERNTSTAQKLIATQKDLCKQWLKAYEDKPADRDENESFNRIVRNFRESQIHAYLNWLDWCQNDIGKEEK